MMREKMTDAVVPCPSSADRDGVSGRNQEYWNQYWNSAPSMREIHSSTWRGGVAMDMKGSVSGPKHGRDVDRYRQMYVAPLGRKCDCGCHDRVRPCEIHFARK